MKKHLFLLAAGALALTACTSEDVIDDVASTRNAIQFENVVNKMTRAKDLDNNFGMFHVFGFYTTPKNDKHANKVFDDVKVEYKDGEWKYAADAVRYWIPDAKYYFYAYSCGSVSKLNSNYGTFSLNTDNYDADGNELDLYAKDRVLDIDKYLCDYTHQHDLIVASNTGGDNFEGILGKESGNSTVALQFKHILSKLRAKFTSSMSPEYTLVIKNVRVTDIYKYGDYSFTQHWSKAFENGDENLEKSRAYLLNTDGVGPEGMTPAQKAEITDAPLSVKNRTDKDADGIDVQEEVLTNTAYVIPLNYNGEENVYLNIDVELWYGKDLLISKTLKATLVPTWQEGYSYVYNIDIKPEDLELGKIEFTTSISPWINENPITEEIDKKTN